MSNLDDIKRLIAEEQIRITELDDFDYLVDEFQEEFSGREIQKGHTEIGLSLTDKHRNRFPEMCRLLALARVTRVKIDNQDYLCLGWLEDESRTVWLCNKPQANCIYLSPDHQLIASLIGGISTTVETISSSLANLNWALATNPSQIIPNYDIPKSRFIRIADIPPFEFQNYYVIAEGANGAQTICHKKTGKLIVISHSSADGLAPLPKWPENSLFIIEGTPSFQVWVEQLAEDYLSEIE